MVCQVPCKERTIDLGPSEKMKASLEASHATRWVRSWLGHQPGSQDTWI